MAEGGGNISIPRGLPSRPAAQTISLQELLQASQARGQQPQIIINCDNVVLEDESDDDDDDDDTHETKCKSEFAKSVERGGYVRKFVNFVYSWYLYFWKDKTLGFQEKLKSFYEKVTVARVTWLDEERPKLIKDYYANLELISDKESTTIDKTFTDKDGKSVTRILVEGQPGYGKTTLANKFAYDWAVGEEYLQKFKLFFLLPLRHLTNQNIEGGIRNIATLCGFKNSTDPVDIVRENAASTLLILDGLDELSDKARKIILEVLFKREYYKEMTVIATSRTWLFSLERKERIDLTGGVSMVSTFYEKQVTILGIPDNERKKFVEKFVPEEDAQMVMNQLEKLTDPVVELFKSPLFLALLAIMIENKALVSELKTKTILYKNLSNFVIRRSSEREQMNPENVGNIPLLDYDFSLFDFQPSISETTDDCQKTFHAFGKKSLKKIMEDDIQFECDSTTHRVYEYGFLINHTLRQVSDTRKHYEPFHFSIMEFAAAYYMYRDYTISNFVLNKKFIQNLRDILLAKGSTSLVPQFLAGLMADKAQELFSYLLPHAHVMAGQKTAFWEMIKECQLTTPLPINLDTQPFLEILEPFIPRYQYMSDYFQSYISATPFCNEVMCFGIERKKILSVCIESNKLWKIPLGVVLPILRFYIWDTDTDLLQEDYYSHLKQVQCGNLHFHLQKFDNVERYFQLFESISAENKMIHFEKSADYSVCVDYLQDANNLNFKFALRVTYPSTNPGCDEFVEILLRRNQIHKLQLYITSPPDYELLDNLISKCVESDYLKSLIIHNLNSEVIKIDINKLTNDGQKQWKSLVFNQVGLKNEKFEIEKIKPMSFVGFNGHVVGNTAYIVGAITVPSLNCSAYLMELLMDERDTSIVFKAVKDLMIIINNKANMWRMWKRIKMFQNLETLQIAAILSLQKFMSQEKLLQCLESLPITKLKLLAPQSGMTFITNFVKGEQGLSCYENLPKNLQSIDYICVHMHAEFESNELDRICEIVLELTECLKKRRIVKVNVISYNIAVAFAIFQRRTIDETIFKVEFDVVEMISPIFVLTDPEAYVLTITLKN